MTTATQKLSGEVTNWTTLDARELNAKHNEISRELQRLAAVPAADRMSDWAEDADWAVGQYDYSHAEHARRGITITLAPLSDKPEMIAKRAAFGMLPGERLIDTIRRAIGGSSSWIVK
jgi:hypothetical protein